jgi:hypothetical protein
MRPLALTFQKGGGARFALANVIGRAFQRQAQQRRRQPDLVAIAADRVFVEV